MKENSLKIIGDMGSHDSLKIMLENENKGKILDVPCGEGILTQYLLDTGWDVVPADIDEGNFGLVNNNFKCINLNRELPFEDNSFDTIVCVNGIHRLFNYSGAISEFNRILKPGGKLFLNVNNYSSILVRMRFLLSGSANNMVNTSSAQQTVADPEAHVRNAIVFPQIALSLENNFFEIDSVKSSVVKLKHKLMLPFAVIIKGLSLFLGKTFYKNNYLKYTNSLSILIGGYYCIEATKVEK